jgi:hypothetical protein
MAVRKLYERLKMSDIIITLPKTYNWLKYLDELKVAEKKGEVLNFKVPTFPKVEPGDKCYITHNHAIRGYNIIVGLEEKEFTCSTTGQVWKGKFIVRDPHFHKVSPTQSMKGFQGWRYYDRTGQTN